MTRRIGFESDELKSTRARAFDIIVGDYIIFRVLVTIALANQRYFMKINVAFEIRFASVFASVARGYAKLNYAKYIVS